MFGIHFYSTVLEITDRKLNNKQAYKIKPHLKRATYKTLEIATH